MAQTPTKPAVPLARSDSDDTNTENLHSGSQTESSMAFTENNVPSITTPLPSGTNTGGIEVDPTKKRNTSFKITGILPSRPPSNSDDDDADESTVTEDDVPDIAPIHPDTTGNMAPKLDTEAIRPNVKNISNLASKEPSNSNVELKYATNYHHNPSESSNNVPVSTNVAASTTGLPANLVQRRNSQQTTGSKGGGPGGSAVPSSIRTGMALGYRFNIFVYDNKLGE